MGWKKLIFGEKMPDKDDPKYEKRYKKEVEAGRKAARFLRIDKMAGCAQRRQDGRVCATLCLQASEVVSRYRVRHRIGMPGT